MFTSFIKREFGKFHVVVAQRQQRNEQKALYTYKASCCFVLLVTVAVVDPIGSLSKDVFERGTSTGSEAFSLFICLDTTKFVLLSFFSPIKTIYLRVSTKPQPNAAKSQLPVDVRRSKTLLLKLPNKSSLFTSVNILYCFIRVRLTVQVLVVPPVHLQ